jgi:arsenite oxidase small subunit
MKPANDRKGRRRTLKVIAGVVVVAIAGAVVGILKILPTGQEPAPTTSTTSSVASQTAALVWPRLVVTNVKSLQVGQALSFNYPMQNTSSMIVKIGVKADNGVGPDGDIVAFSRICQHQGCLITYLGGTIMEGNCPCHGSLYDFIHNANVRAGPTTLPVPRVLLEYEAATGDIYAVGMGPPVIYGQGPQGDTNPNDLLQYDLQGGQIVTQITTSPM